MNHSRIPGMLTRAELGDLIERGEIETVLTVFPDMYGRLMGKRITGHFFMDHVLDDGMHACDYLLACAMPPGYRRRRLCCVISTPKTRRLSRSPRAACSSARSSARARWASWPRAA